MKINHLTFTSFLFLVFFTTGFSQVPNYIPTNGLVGWWPFNGNPNDESGNGNDGTVNGATLTTDRFGVASRAYSFDGVNNYISTTPTLPIGSAPRSVSSWFKTIASAIPTSQYPNIQTITGWGNPFSGAVIFPQQVLAPTGKAYFESGSGGNQIWSQNSVNDGSWHQIVTTYAGNNGRVKMYIDGILQDSSVVVALATASSFFGIGNVSFANVPFQGQIDDIGIWDRALTDQEISNLYFGCQDSLTSEPTNQTASIGNSANFITSFSDPNSTFQWQTNIGLGFQDVVDAGQYQGGTNDTLTISNVNLGNDNQQFRCIVSLCSDTTMTATLSVNNNTGFDDSKKATQIVISPNPTQTDFTIEVPDSVVGERFVVLDNLGRVVLKDDIRSTNQQISIQHLSRGTYVIKVGNQFNQILILN